MKWLSENREWIFSGVGSGIVVFALTTLIQFRRKRSTRNGHQIARNVTGPVVQGGRDVSVTIGSGTSEEGDQVGHDRRVFREGHAIVDHAFLDPVLKNIGADHSHYMSETMRLESFVRFLRSPDSRFISTTIRQEAEALGSVIGELLAFLATHFFVYPQNQARDDTRFCMYPSLNIDRDGDGTNDQDEKYELFTTQLIAKLDAVEHAYKVYRERVRTELAI